MHRFGDVVFDLCGARVGYDAVHRACSVAFRVATLLVYPLFALLLFALLPLLVPLTGCVVLRTCVFFRWQRDRS